ncbi:hypothetical protein F52700_13426 [Fusarium sp. NRRL 52700]|nr:hypothetical protein F52700_13426 [Fusarium sp. NRRL 52700]
MPLIPTTPKLSAAPCLVRPPLPQKIHSAPNLRDADNSSSAVTLTRRSASDSFEDPTPSTPPIELQFLDSRSKILSPPPLNPSRPTLSSANSSSSTSGSHITPDKLSRRQRTCIFAGTVTGAQLKTDNEKKEAIQEFRATSPNEQIAALLSQRKTLLSQKAVLQRKMDDFEVRVKEREAEKAREKEGP